MSKIDLMSSEWADMIFAGRNKSYGAYRIRMNTGKRNLISIMAVLFIALICQLGLTIENLVYDALVNRVVMNQISELSALKQPKKDEMIAAITDHENSSDVTNVKPIDVPDVKSVEETQVAPSENVTMQQDSIFTSKPIVTAGNGALTEIMLDEVKPQIMEYNMNEPESFHVIEELPEFPGGATAFMKWITTNLKYPKFAQDGKIEGTVVVSFIVDTKGNVQKLRLEKSNNRALGVEVIKIMGNMPKWKPGHKNGKPCTAMIAVPINFEL